MTSNHADPGGPARRTPLGRRRSSARQPADQSASPQGRTTSEAAFQQLVELAPDAIVVTDAAGHITLVNRQTELLFGYGCAELLGQPVEALLPERFRSAQRPHRRHSRTVPRTQAMGTPLEVWGHHRDGHAFPVEVSYSSIPASGEGTASPVAVMRIIRDRSERRRQGAARAAAASAAQDWRQLLAITETAFTHPDLDDLLHTLLGRIHEVLAVDNVAILLAEADGHSLLVRAASGLEEEVVGGLHIPVGEGFAGRIAASRQPLAVEDLRTFPVVSPFLRAKLRSVVGVPLLVDDRLVGVLHVGSATPRQFSEDEVHLLQLVGERVALAVDHARQYAAMQQAQAEAVARTRDLEATIEAMADAVGVYDADGHLVRANTALHRLFALDGDPGFRALAAGERATRLQVRHPDGRPLLPGENRLRHLLRGEVLASADPLEVVVAALDGREVWLSITGAPLRAEDGRLVGAVTVARDVTERRHLERRTQQALEALLAMAQALVEQPERDADDQATRQRATHDLAHRLAELTASVLGCQRVGLVAVGPQTQEQRALAVVGLTAEQESQWWAEQEQLPRYGEGADPALLARFEAGEALVLDMTAPPFDHLPNPYGVTTSLAVPLRLGGRVVGILSLDHGGPRHEYREDERALAEAVGQLAALVIERERLLHERAEARASELALREATRRMDEFLSIASHELKTPLTTLKVNLQMALRRVQPIAAPAPLAGQVTETELAEALVRVALLMERAERNTDRLNGLVDDLLDVSRIHAGQLELRMATCDLASVTREMVEEQRQWHPDRRIQAALPDEAVFVLGDANRLAQVMTNFLTNALKYSPADRPVEARLEVAHGEARVSVRDEGAGLAPDQRDRVWERFYRAPGITVQNGVGVGLGLGLHISRTIVERHGGTVGVDSTVGEGSTFWFTVPLATAKTDADTTTARLP